MEPQILFSAAVAIAISGIYYVIQKLWSARDRFRRLQKLGMPMLPHNFLLGHLLCLKEALEQFPANAHKVYGFGAISRKFNGAYYLDLWPAATPFLVVTSPTLAHQAMQTTRISIEKPDDLRTWFKSLTGGTSMFDARPEQWRGLRNLFRSGFSNNHLMTLAPMLVEETLVYCQTLRAHAEKGDMIYLDPITLRFVIDIVGQLLLNADLGTQKGYSPLGDTMLQQVKMKTSSKETDVVLQLFNFVRPVKEWYNGRKMDAYINAELDKRYEIYKAQSKDSASLGEKSQPECIIDLALQDYMSDPAKATRGLDNKIRTIVARNTRMFLFAGHDSTSSTICYCYYLLFKNPSTLARIRAEHDELLGTDLASVPSRISEDPYVLNKLEYTNSVIKETLRLFPPASSIREGAPGVDLVDDDGTVYPTENTLVWVIHEELHRSPRYWKRGDEFIPERWQVEPNHELYPVKGAWRPFETGPRDCLGQNLVMMEIKIVLALTLREFDITSMYDDFDKDHPKMGLEDVEGESVYQVEEGAAHPRDHYPCRVSLRGGACSPR